MVWRKSIPHRFVYQLQPAMLIVLGGTLGAVIIGTSFDQIINIPKMYMKAFNAAPVR